MLDIDTVPGSLAHHDLILVHIAYYIVGVRHLGDISVETERALGVTAPLDYGTHLALAVVRRRNEGKAAVAGKRIGRIGHHHRTVCGSSARNDEVGAGKTID